ncbi:MAG: TolC family protein [Nitrospirae bacterium]|nr:TolC family protein [Nitrospirota bacterium]
MKTLMVRGIALLMTLLLSATVALAGERSYTLEDAYEAALGTNESMKIVEEDVVQSDSRVDQAGTYRYPRLYGQAAYTKYNETLPPGGGPVIFQPDEQFRAGLIMTQPLYTGGRTLAALRTAEQMREASRSGLSVAKQDILIKVSEAYYGVLKAQKAIDISQRSLERMERHQQVTEREAATRKTKANASALLRAKSLVSQARISLVRSRDGLMIARDKLNLLTKLPVDAVFLEPQTLYPPEEDLARLQESALRNRDDYAGAKLNRSIAAENVTIVRGGHYPQVYAEAGLTYLESQPVTAMDATSYYGGLRLTIPLFEGGLMKAEVADAKSKQRQADLSADFLRTSIASEVHEAFVNLQTIGSVIDNAKLQVEYARDNFDVVEGLFAEGLAPSLSIIDAEQALTFAERELVNATYDRQVAILRLKKSIGMMGKEKQ